MELNDLKQTLKTAYLQLADDMYAIGRDASGAAILPDDGTVTDLMRSAAGKVGAKVSASVKREKRRCVFEALQQAKQQQMDLTPTIVQHMAVRLIGRHFDNKQVIVTFGTPGRTAADKSKLSPRDTIVLEASIKSQLRDLEMVAEQMKDKAKVDWVKSARRNDILDDWRRQRG
ncbi:hypothetical protein NFHSH190041_17640 [Shewanella sp. NFH-SH190041]|uniref:hypothetical protein n=1 Tax=Shewanella sp. NFH-SH190041 TaxID=2950245 RepID=UPI0021C402FF|nr:hypothetical protein [Shewanella sp. NFH-SH190041]BDM64312.1 hypothetical protein NFHSH190041_17640 [Shewanella sp. NFH-SH190041]